MKKTNASKSSQKVILENIAEKINKSLEIFNAGSEENEYYHRAFIENDVVKVVPDEKTNFFSGAVMETIMKTIEAYRKKYDNLIWGVDTTPVMKHDLKGEIYWLHAPQISINFYRE